MIFWRIEKHLTRLGWQNARQLASGAQIGYPAAWTIMLGGPVGRVDTGTLEKLARAFGVDDPLTLLEHVPE